MDARRLLDQLLQCGGDLVSKGKNVAEEKLGIPAQGPEREAMLSSMGKGAAIAGTLALLLGTRSGRNLTGTGLKLGSLAAIGGLAYKAYNDWQTKRGDAPIEPGTPVGELTGPQAQDRSLALLRAMIAAAKADGHIDENEREKIDEYIERLELDTDTLHFIKDEIAKPLDPSEVAAGVDSPEAAAEIYLTSLMLVDSENNQERTYLAELAKQLGLDADLVAELEQQVTS